MSTLFKKQRHVAKLSRHPHDLSFHRTFTSGIGTLNPVLFDYLNPGDSVLLNDHLTTIAQPMQSNSFMRLSQHVEYFFVPMKQLWQAFPSFYYGIMDVHSSFYKTAKTLTPPSVNLRALYNYLSGSGWNTKLDLVGRPLLEGFGRLVDLMDVGHVFTQSTNDTSVGYNIIPWLFCAYQKVWYDVYRLDDFISPNPSAYNLDGYSSSLISDGSDFGVVDMFTMRYRPWKKDLFTNIFPNPYFNELPVSGQGSDFTAAGSLARLYSYAGLTVPASQNNVNAPVGVYDSDFGQSGSMDISQNNNSQLNDSSWNVSQSSGRVTQNGPVLRMFNNENEDYVNGSQSIDVTMLSTLYAIDKLKKITGNAAKHYDSQTLAHFGYDMPKGIHNEVYRLGGHDSSLNVGVVYATATTGENGSVLGEQGGRMTGSSGNNKPIKFTAPCHGILLALHSMDAESDYASVGLDPLHTLSSSDDFYKPEYDSLGMTPMFLSQVIMPDASAGSSMVANSYKSRIYGWTYRYSYLKSKVDRTNGAINYTLRDWQPTRNMNASGNLTSSKVSSLYISPSYTDACFLVNYGNAWTGSSLPSLPWSQLFQNDPFIHSLDFTYKKISVMSTYGVPNV